MKCSQKRQLRQCKPKKFSYERIRIYFSEDIWLASWPKSSFYIAEFFVLILIFLVHHFLKFWIHFEKYEPRGFRICRRVSSKWYGHYLGQSRIELTILRTLHTDHSNTAITIGIYIYKFRSNRCFLSIRHVFIYWKTLFKLG